MKILKTIKGLFLTLAVTLIFSSGVLAATNDKPFENAQNYAKKFLQDYGVKSNVSEPIPLYNFNDKIESLFFSVDNGGYVIVNLSDYSVPEFSPTDNNKFITSSSEKYYYDGPLAYYKKDKGEFVNLKTKKALDKDDMSYLKESKKSIEKKAIEYKAKLEKFRSEKGDNKYSLQNICMEGTVPSYSYNPTGICGSTASAMMLRYYDIYYNDNYVPSYLESRDGVNLIKHLVPYIDGDQPGSSVYDVKKGVNNYLKDQGVNNSVDYYRFGFPQVKKMVENNNPFVLGLYNHPKYHGHWVTAYGYAGQNYGSDFNISYSIVNDGWGSTNVYIQPQYCDWIIG